MRATCCAPPHGFPPRITVQTTVSSTTLSVVGLSPTSVNRSLLLPPPIPRACTCKSPGQFKAAKATQEYTDRVDEDDEDDVDDESPDWGGSDDEDDTGGDLAKDTPDDAGGGSAPPPGAGGCAPPPAEGEESVLDRLQRAAREAKDGLPVYTQDTIEEAAGGALRPAPPELMQEMRRHHVIFCSVCFGRGWQVRRALPATLLRLWPYTQDQQYAP